MLFGLDGCKMFKSYDNIILLFVVGVKGMCEVILCIVIDLWLLGELKDLDSLVLFIIFCVFVSEVES